MKIKKYVFFLLILLNISNVGVLNSFNSTATHSISFEKISVDNSNKVRSRPGEVLNLVWPTTGQITEDLPISTSFGPRQLVSDNFADDFHRGIDISKPIGEPLYAIQNGVVERAGDHPDFSDPMIRVQHEVPEGLDLGFETFYAMYLHVNETLVTEDEEVLKGQLIGYSGAASLNDYAHLHFEIREAGVYSTNATHPFEYLPKIDNSDPIISYYSIHDKQIDMQVIIDSEDLDLIEIGLYGTLESNEINFVYNLDERNHETPNLSHLDQLEYVENGIHMEISPSFHNSESIEMNYDITFRYDFINDSYDESSWDLTVYAVDIFQNEVGIKAKNNLIGARSSIINFVYIPIIVAIPIYSILRRKNS